MTEEFNLSEKINSYHNASDEGTNCIISSIRVEDVKEFIKRLKDRVEEAQEDCGNLDWISKEQAGKIIDKLAGDKLR